MRFVKLFAVFHVCMGLVGGHWFALQTIAWAQMLVAYSAEQSIGQAVADTFSGERPCEMCETIQKEKSAEKQQEAATGSTTKIEGAMTAPVLLVIPARHGGFDLTATIFWNSNFFSPPTPPPKALNL